MIEKKKKIKKKTHTSTIGPQTVCYLQLCICVPSISKEGKDCWAELSIYISQLPLIITLSVLKLSAAIPVTKFCTPGGFVQVPMVLIV